LEDNTVIANRAFDMGSEMVKCTLPCLLTVVGTANQPRPASARRRIEYKLAATPQEYGALLERWPEFETEEALEAHLIERNLKIEVWSAADVDANENLLGLSGSPTQVYKVNFVHLGATEAKDISADEESIKAMIEELVQEYIVG
jgi:electron transfer flavoprotein alpha/beta subunit